MGQVVTFRLSGERVMRNYDPPLPPRGDAGYLAARRRAWEEAGLCYACGAASPVPGQKRCQGCVQGGRASNAAYMERIFEGYGGRCSCCGEARWAFLTIDHVDGQNGLRGAALYRDIIRRGFPGDYRILCWNCNAGRERNGGVCPHEEERTRLQVVGSVGI